MPRSVERRAERLCDLDSTRQLLEATTSALRAVHQRGLRPSAIKIRSRLFCGARDQKPPISAIAAPRGLNLQLYLLTLFEAQCRKRSGEAGPSPLPVSAPGPDELSWVNLAFSRAKENLHAVDPITERGNRIRQVKSAFARLATESLVLRNVGVPKKPMAVMPLHESGFSGPEKHSYIIPEWHENPPAVISVPVQFFLNGWVYLLSPAEIRMYFILRHLAARFPEAHLGPGIYCTAHDKEGLYFITRDVYESHINLTRFGLVARVDSSLRHKDGKMVNYREFVKGGGPLPLHRFKIEPDFAFSEAAASRIRRALMNYPTTPFGRIRRRSMPSGG